MAYTPVLPLDLTGTAVTNQITDEVCDLLDAQRRIVLLKWVYFYEDSLVVTDDTTGIVLTPDQYQVTEFFQDAAMRSGKNIYAAMLITDVAVGNRVKISYQALGGPYTRNKSEILDWYEERIAGVRAGAWGDLIDVPKTFEPFRHKQHSKDLYGAEGILVRLKAIEAAMVTGHTAQYNAATSQILKKLANAEHTAQDKTTSKILEHFSYFKSGITKNSIGLSNLNNYGVMDRATATAIAAVDYEPNPTAQEEYLSLNGLDAFGEALRDNLVPMHETGLGQVEPRMKEAARASMLSAANGAVFILYSKNQAIEGGLEFDIDVYPPGIREDEQVAVMRLSHNAVNHGGAWMGFSLQTHHSFVAVLESDSCAQRFVWRRILVEGDLDEFTKLAETHIKDRKNPHRLNKNHVGLPLVENLPVVTVEEILNETAVRKLITLDTFMYYLKQKFSDAVAPPVPPGAEAEKRPMHADQIIFSSCRSCITQEEFPSPDQLIRTWCEGTTLFARYTDGKGGFKDSVLELNSDDCNYIVNIKEGTVLAVWCDGTTMKSTIADGRGNTFDVMNEHLSEKCGYVPPLVEGTVIAVYCSQGGHKIQRIADGAGGSFELYKEYYSTECGYRCEEIIYEPPPPPVIVPPPLTDVPFKVNYGKAGAGGEVSFSPAAPTYTTHPGTITISLTQGQLTDDWALVGWTKFKVVMNIPPALRASNGTTKWKYNSIFQVQVLNQDTQTWVPIGFKVVVEGKTTDLGWATCEVTCPRPGDLLPAGASVTQLRCFAEDVDKTYPFTAPAYTLSSNEITMRLKPGNATPVPVKP